MTEREAKLKAVWRKTHRDYKTTIGGVQCILVLREGGTWLVQLDGLTDEEIERKLPRGTA